MIVNPAIIMTGQGKRNNDLNELRLNNSAKIATIIANRNATFRLLFTIPGLPLPKNICFLDLCSFILFGLSLKAQAIDTSQIRHYFSTVFLRANLLF